MLAASPDGELVTGQPLPIGMNMASYDVSSGSAAAPVYGFLPDSVSIAADGTVAAGVGKGNTNEVFVFAPGGSAPLNTYNSAQRKSAHRTR
jgi:hypothetical protein